MSLAADLSARLDAGGLVETLLGRTTSVSGELDAIAMPAPGGEANEATEIAGRIDLSGIGSSVLQAAGEIAPALGNLGDAAQVLQPLTSLIDLLEQLAAADLETQFRQLTAQLAGELDDTRREGFAGVLVRLSDLFGDSSQARLLRDLAAALSRTAGVDLQADAFQPPEIAAATAALVRVLGGLMSLETVLAETERLTGVMRGQLDVATLTSRRAAITAAFASPSLSAGSLRSLETDLLALRDLAAGGMGFGEATLVYLDFALAQTHLALAATMVRETDLVPLERTLSALAAKIAPVLAVDITGAPARGLDEVLTLLEGRVDDVAQRITAFDVTKVTAPLTTALEVVTDLPNRLTAAVTEVTVAVRGALDSLRALIERLPLDAIGNAVRTAIEPVVELLHFLSQLLNTIKAALIAAVTAVRATLGNAEAAVDDLKQAVETLFRSARDFLDGLNLAGVIGTVADGVKTFADLIAKAQLKPYFDTAIGAVDTAAGIVEKVPFSLIPDSMEQDVVDVLRPIKSADVEALENEIKSLLQIGPDGQFQLRPEIENALKTIQDKYDALIQEIRRLDPHKAVEQIDAGLAGLIGRIREIAPQVELAPVEQALAQLRNAVGSFDLDDVLRPLSDAFAQVLAAADRYAPGPLIRPIEQRIDDVRERLIDATRLREITGYLDQIRAQAEGLIDRLDPVRLQPEILSSLQEARDLLERFPAMKPGGAFGSLVAAMLSGAGLRVHPLSFEVVLDWLGTVSGTDALARRAGAVADAIRDTREGVSSFDPQAFAASLAPAYAALRTAVNAWPAGPAKSDCAGIVDRLDPAAVFGPLAANRTRYLERLGAAEAVSETLRRTGFSEVDVATARVRRSLGPFDPAGARLREFAEKLGLTGFDVSLNEVLRRLFRVATPDRLVGLVMPLFTALRGRAMALIDSVLTPLTKAVEDLLRLLEAVDLTPLREAIDGVYQDVRGQIAALSPAVLLGDALDAFRGVQQQVAQFDPLADIQAALTEMRDTTTRVLGKLKASEMLAEPLAIYDDIVALLDALDIEHLMQPVLDQIDAIARQVDEGLTGTVDSFQRLQGALPDRVGSTELSASAAVS